MADQEQEKNRRLREIRRRRILENGEERLKRITSGYKSKKQELDETVPSSPTADNINTDFPDDNLCLSNDMTNESINVDFLTDSKDNETSSNVRPRNSSRFDSDYEASPNGSLNIPSSNETYAFPKKVSDAETRSFGRRRSDARRNSTCTQMMMDTLQFSSFSLISLRPWLAAALAFCVKACFLFTDTFLFNETIFLPFLILEIVLFTWTKYETQVYAKPAIQSLIPGVLVLCGVPLSVISSFSSVWCNIQCAIQDFTVYLFSFVFSWFFYENYIL